MHAGLFLLRLPPDHFWALTPRELFCATGGLTGELTGGLKRELAAHGHALDRAGLDALIAAFPDLPHHPHPEEKG